MHHRLLAVLITAALHTTVAAQADANDPLARVFYPPEFVMKQQLAIGLRAEQIRAVASEVGAAQSRFIELQARLQIEFDKLQALATQAPVNEKDTLEQLERVLGLERDIKRTMITLLVRTKNVLDKDQRERLDRVRSGIPR